MKSQFNSVFEFNMEFELVEVDGDGMRSGISSQFPTPQDLIESKRVFLRS